MTDESIPPLSSKTRFVSHLPDLIKEEDYLECTEQRKIRLRIDLTDEGVDILGDSMYAHLVEESNLSRTILFRQSDLGRFKVEAAADALWELNPNVSVDVRSQLLIHGVGLGEIRDASLRAIQYINHPMM